MKAFYLLIQCAIFEFKILNFRFKLPYHIRQSRSLYSAYRKLIVVSYELILQKQKPLFKNFNRSMFVNKFFNNLDGHDSARVRKLGCVIHTKAAAKEVAQIKQPGFDRSVITKIAIFILIEARQQFITDCQNQFTGLFVKFLCSSKIVLHSFSIFIQKQSSNAVDTPISSQFVDANGIYRALRGLHPKPGIVKANYKIVLKHPEQGVGGRK